MSLKRFIVSESQREHREGGVGSSEAPLQKDSLALSLLVDTTCSEWGHLPSRRRTQTSLLGAAEVIIGLSRASLACGITSPIQFFFKKHVFMLQNDF